MRVNPNYTPDILSDLWQSQAQEQTYIQELATGKRVNVPSDDPAAAAADVQNDALQSQTDQYLQNTSNLEGSCKPRIQRSAPWSLLLIRQSLWE